MSFILDALRRAETQRGNQPPAIAADGSLGNIAEKSSSMPAPRRIAVLLLAAVAIAVLAINFLNPQDTNTPVNAESDYRTTPAQTERLSTIAPDTPLREVAESGRRVVRPLGAEVREPTPARSNSTVITPGTVSVSQAPLSSSDTPTRTFTNLANDRGANQTPLPSYTELVLSGWKMPEFHLDIHVYASAPERRFVFVNNRKYREGEQLDEGGTVERITPVGVVLNHRGRRFELVPD